MLNVISIKTSRQIRNFTIARLFLCALVLFILSNAFYSYYVYNNILTINFIQNTFFFICIFLPLILYYLSCYFYEENKVLFRVSFLMSIAFQLFYIIANLFIIIDFDLITNLKLLVLIILTILTLMNNSIVKTKKILLYFLFFLMLVISGISIGSFIINRHSATTSFIIFIVLFEMLSNIFLIGFYLQNKK